MERWHGCARDRKRSAAPGRERDRERERERESACASERERWREGAWLRKVVYSWGSGDAHHHPWQFLDILGRRDGIVNRAGERRTW